MLPALLRRSLSRRSIVAGVVVLMALSAVVSWHLFHGADIELGINAGTQRRPLVVANGKVEQMPAGDYLAANTLVDTSACSATNVIKWDGTQFACGAGGGGSGGGITNSAGANVIMKSDGTNAVTSSVSDSTTQTTLGHQIISTSMGSNDGNVCGQAVASEWVGPMCLNFQPHLNDNIHDVIDIEWGTVGSGASNSTEQIPFVTHVQGNVDATAAAQQAFAYQGSVHPTKIAGSFGLSCAAFQGGSSGCDTNYSFQGDGGTLYNAEDIFIGASGGSGGTIHGTFLMDGNALTFGNSTGGSTIENVSATTFDRTVTVDPTGSGVPVKIGALGSATVPSGGDVSKIETFAGNGKNVFLTFNSALTGQQGFAAYNSANGSHDDLHWWQYNGVGQDVMVFQGVTGNVGFGQSGYQYIAAGGAPAANHGTLTAGSTNWVGSVTAVGAFTSVVLTYSTAFGTQSWCTATVNSAGTPEFISVTNSASAPQFACFNTTTGVAANCVNFTYQCIGQ